MYDECLALRDLTRQAGATFIVNDHVDLALLVEADGVHIGQEDLPPAAVRKLLGPGKIIGLSTHGPSQARAAQTSGLVDYIGVGPIFATKTKKDVCDPVGLEYLDYVARTHRLAFRGHRRHQGTQHRGRAQARGQHGVPWSRRSWAPRT